jgi:2-C-methyl-D-erythritol 4-phosphate cytidylyltransferase
MLGRMRVSVIVPGAGEGRRMGSGGDAKPFLTIGGETVVGRTLAALDRSTLVDDIVLVMRAEDLGRARAISSGKLRVTIAGGATRQESVRLGLEAVKALRAGTGGGPGGPQDSDHPGIIVVHDAVRPFVRTALIDAVITAAASDGAAVAAVRSRDTVRIQKDLRGPGATPDRSSCWLVQTPQAFHFDLFESSLAAASREGFFGTDEASIVERSGARVTIVEGDPSNIKITTPGDLEYAAALERTPGGSPAAPDVLS